MIEERYQEIVEAIGSELFSSGFDPNTLRTIILEKGRQLGVTPQEAREFIGMVLQKNAAKED